MAIRLSDYQGFQWDTGNFRKNWERHRVRHFEAEQVFFNQPLLLLEDDKHSLSEQRFRVLGKTNANRFLFISFTTRRNLIRIISARDMSVKERYYYAKIQKDSIV